MSTPQTKSSNMRVWADQGWVLRMPLNVPITQEAPALSRDIRIEEPREVSPAGFVLVWPSRVRNIDMLTHETLLEKSLQEYNSIWRNLAKI